MNTYHTRRLNRLSDLPARAWNALAADNYPFLRHEFLVALEDQQCLGPEVGWTPCHLVCEDSAGKLLGALPMYLKANSFGEFVFDWSWAGAYERAGLDYYPKLVVAAPFTPATGPRVLTVGDSQRPEIAEGLIRAAIAVARELGASSVHWLFARDPELAAAAGLLPRIGYQFHWENRRYGTFEEFLGELSAKRRKEIRRERRQAAASGLDIERVPGGKVGDEDWAVFHRLYRTTFAKHGNYPALTLGFFRRIAETLPHETLLIRARRAGRTIAAAYFLVGSDTLYGRYWGCAEEIPALHFELCYYQGIEYCIERGLARFEPGAQGEHKISRGFLPVATRSFHWIGHPEFRQAIARFLERETAEVKCYMDVLMARSPFRQSA